MDLKMKILVAGGTGFIGRHLVRLLLANQYEVFVLSRDIAKVKKIFDARVHAINWDTLNTFKADEFTAIINLVGENIGENRWSALTKKNILDSRIDSTKFLVSWCLSANQHPRIYNASAIGIYGLQQGDFMRLAPLTETISIPWGYPTDFLSEVGQKWEQALMPAVEAGVAVTLLRFAPVLKKGEGVLKKLEPVFNLGLGGVIGKGTQAFSWVHIDDAIRAIEFLLKNPGIVGPVNICAPESVMQKDFAKTLAKVMHRPALISTPAWILRLRFGQMADELLLAGQKAYPARLLDNEFTFLYPKLTSALAHEWK